MTQALQGTGAVTGAEPVRRTPAGRQPNLWLAGRRLGVVDIGSNSIRLLAVEVIDEKSWTTLAEERAMTRLAHGLSSTGMLDAGAMASSVAALERFRGVAQGLGVTHLRAFATAAVREAKNRNKFTALVGERTGLTVELVSAVDEGRLTHKSVSRVYDLSKGLCAVVDIGGGSMEVVFSQNGVITENTSMPLGAVRVTETFGGPAVASGARFKKMRRFIEAEIREHVRVHETSPTIVVGCGGAFTTLLTIASAARGVLVERRSAELAGLGPVTRQQVRELLDELRGMKVEERARTPGLPADRADIVVAGFTAIERLLRHLGAGRVHVHPGGFREGLLLRMIEKDGVPVWV